MITLNYAGRRNGWRSIRIINNYFYIKPPDRERLEDSALGANARIYWLLMINNLLKRRQSRKLRRARSASAEINQHGTVCKLYVISFFSLVTIIATAA